MQVAGGVSRIMDQPSEDDASGNTCVRYFTHVPNLSIKGSKYLSSIQAFCSPALNGVKA